MPIMYGIDPNAKRVTQEEFVELLKSLDSKGMVPISVTQVTKFRTRKPADFDRFDMDGYTDPKAYFMKVAQVNGNIGLLYEAKVNRERDKAGLESDFKAKKSTYEYVTKGIRKKGSQHYLAFYPVANAASMDPTLVGRQSGVYRVVDEEEISSIIPERKYNPNNRQGLAEGEEVQVQHMSLASVIAARVDGQSYIISDVDDARMSAFGLVIS